MKTFLLLIIFLSTCVSQQDSFYMGLGIINADLNTKETTLEKYTNSFTQNPYFFLGYDVTAYEFGHFRIATNFGLSYLTLENKYSNQEDKYNLIVLNLIPKLCYNVSEKIAAVLKFHTDIKLVEFFANVDGSTEVRDRLSYLEGFNIHQIGFEVGVQLLPEWMHQYSVELTFISYLTHFYEDAAFTVEMKPTFQLSVYTTL